MANTIIIKKSSVVGKVPLATDLQVGELAVNLADQKIYSKNAGGTVVQLGGGSGSGDVVGPASAIDNALVRFDGTTGKLVQNSTATLDDTGNMDTASVKADYFDLDTAATAPANAVGREAWDDGYGAPIVGLKGGNVTYYYGQQEFARVYNGSGAAMTKGQVVYIVGAQGNRIDVRLAKADAESTSANTIGLVAESIANGAEGWVQTSGPLPKLDTNALTAGDAIYLSPTTAGAYTTTRPSAPNHTVILGFVERVSATVGSIYLKVDNGYELNELHNVNISTPTGGQLLAYDQTNGYWKNITLTDGTGISVTETAGGAITVTNTAPDQTVALTGAGATTITGTYPNFTISSVNTTYSAATSTVPGLIELASDTAQTVAANAVTTTASRTYGLQVNAAGQGVVNVPWTDTNSGGTVTSVATSGTVSGITLSGGPITTTGTITLGGTLAVTPSNFASQTANTVLAAPSGAAGVPTFRAIVAADIPTLNQNTTGTAANITATSNSTLTTLSALSLPYSQLSGTVPTWNQNTTGTAANVTGTVAIGNGGTGATTKVLAFNALTPMTTLGDTEYHDGTNGVRLAGNTTATKKFLRQTGTGTVSAAPAWDTVTATDVGLGNVTNNAQVTSVTATSPVASSGGTTPAISLSTAYGDTLNPYASKTANFVLAAPNGIAGVPTFRAVVAADIPTLNQNTTGTAAGLSATLAVTSGGTGGTTAATARTGIGATTVGGNMFTLTNPSAITFPRFNADNTVSALDAATFRTAIGAGTSSTTGTVTSVATSGTVSGITLTGGTITTTGTVTLGGTLSVLPSNFASQTANTFLAAPNGAAGVPTFRAIAAADIPTLNQNTTGSSGSCTGNAATATTASSCSGNSATATTATNQAGGAANQIQYNTAASISSFIAAPTTASTYLGWNGTAFAWSAPTAAAIGTTTQVAYNNAGTMAGSANLTFNGTNLTCGGTISSTSDERLKTNWRDVQSGFVEKLAQVKHGIYDRTDEKLTQAGVSAQSLREVLGEVVMEDENGMLSVNYGNAALVSAIKLAERVLSQEDRIAALEEKLNLLLAK